MPKTQKRPRGRPPLPPEDWMKSLNVNFPVWVLVEIERRADERDVTMATVIREIIERSLKRSRA